jgi:hypothetical protein
MGFRDRAAGHAVLKECDFSRLSDLPKDVAFRALLYRHKKLPIWFIGTRVNVDKWPAGEDPFLEFAPPGSPEFVKLVGKTAASFCRAFDQLYEFGQKTFGKDGEYLDFGPSSAIGELSLGLQLATRLDCTVFSFIDDDDPVEANLACVCEPGRIVRIRCVKATFHFLFENGITTVSKYAKRRPMPAFKIISPIGFTPPPPVDLNPVFKRMTRLPEVKAGRPIDDFLPFVKQVVSEELNRFVGADIAVEDSVVPDFRKMKPLAELLVGKKVKIMK